MEKLTKRQASIFSFLRDHTHNKGYPPTVREIKAGLNLSSHSSIQNALSAIEQKGYIRRSGKARAIEFIDPRMTSRPLILPLAGRIRAGRPHPAVEDVQGYVAMDRSLVAGNDNFLLKVEGDSMRDAHILDGDYVVIKPRPTADNGDIVAAVVDDEATIKRLYKEKGLVRLQPANPAFDPIVIGPHGPEMFIVGKVVSVIRDMETSLS